MRIKQHQFGGIVYTPVNVAAQQAAAASGTSPTGSSSSSSGEKISGTYAKELIDQIKEYGIQSDVNQFSTRVANLLQLAQNPVTGDFNMKDIVKVQQEANKVKLNKENYDNAIKRLEAQNSWSEVAINTSGRMYVLDEDGSLKEVTPEEYSKNNDKYRALTNKDLLSLRETQSNLAYNQNILHDLQSSVGISEITEYVKKIVKDFGETETGGYSKKGSKVKAGLEKLMAEGPDGIYKYTTKESIADQDVEYALQYLYESLPSSYRQTIDAKTAAEQGDPSRAADKFKLLGMILTAHTSRSYKVDYDKEASAVAGYSNAASGGSESQTEDTLPIRVAKGDLTETTAFISPVAQRASDTAQMAFKAWNAGQLQDKNRNMLSANNLKDLIPQVYQLQAADTSTVVFGNQLLSDSEQYGVVWDGSSLMSRVALPTKVVNGKQVPDFDLLTKYNEINAWIKENPGVTQLEIQNKFGNLQSQGITFDPNTKSYTIDSSRVGYFLTFAAYGSKDTLDIKNESKPFLEKVSRRDGKQLKDWFNHLAMFGKDTVSKKDRSKNGLDESEANDFYYGNVYIPIVDPVQGFQMSKDQFYGKSTFTNVAQKNELSQTVQAVSNADTQFVRNFN